MRLRLATTVTRLRSPILTAEIAERLERTGWSVRVVDMAEVPDRQGILDAFGRGLRLPDWESTSWDALDDALRDASWWEPGRRGRAIIVARAGRLGEDAIADWPRVCALLRTATEHWKESDTPLGVLVRGRALGPAAPLSGSPPAP